MAYPSPSIERACSTASRRDGQTRRGDALPAPTTTRVLDAPGQLALLVTGRVRLEQALAWLGQWMGRLRRPWGGASLPAL
jgi:hypothetical protein